MSYVDEMMSYGVRFWQYKRGFIHAKVVIVDQLMASVGTANMDLRSFFFNFEVNALLFDMTRIAELEQDFCRITGQRGDRTVDIPQAPPPC